MNGADDPRWIAESIAGRLPWDWCPAHPETPCDNFRCSRFVMCELLEDSAPDTAVQRQEYINEQTGIAVPLRLFGN